jgi:CTP synthase
MVMAGINERHNLVEIVELEDHPWFVGVQFHPEFKTKPMSPHPLFREFIGAAIERAGGRAGADVGNRASSATRTTSS